MLKQHRKLLHRVQIPLEVLLGAAVFLAVAARPGMFSPAGDGLQGALLAFALLAVLAWPVMLEHCGLHDSQRRRTLGSIATRLVVAGAVVAATLQMAALALRPPVAPRFPEILAAAQFLALGGLHLGVAGGLRLARRRGRNTRNILVLGSGPRARDVAEAMERHPEWGLRVVGFTDEAVAPIDPDVPKEKFRTLREVPSILQEEVVDEVIVACPRSLLAAIDPAVDVFGSAGIPITLLTDLFGERLRPRQVTRLDSLSALSFAPVHHGRLELAAKRLVDVVGSSVLLIVASPILALGALAVRWSSPGPILFRQVRCGLNGRSFEMLKFRSMYVDAEGRKAALAHLNEMDGPVFKIANDPRITPAGRWMRRWSIDELPQLWNVLRGEMSLVGPRPPVPEEVSQYELTDRRRLSMRPGLTCLWQVSGRNQLGFADWVKLDLEYIDQWSLALDLRVLLKTLPAVVRGTGS